MITISAALSACPGSLARHYRPKQSILLSVMGEAHENALIQSRCCLRASVPHPSDSSLSFLPVFPCLSLSLSLSLSLHLCLSLYASNSHNILFLLCGRNRLLSTPHSPSPLPHILITAYFRTNRGNTWEKKASGVECYGEGGGRDTVLLQLLTASELNPQRWHFGGYLLLCN